MILTFTHLKERNGVKRRDNMNISHYDFHDGCLIDIKHYKDNIEISMESAQIIYDDLKDDLSLSTHNTLKGKLHIEKIKEIKVNNIPFFGEFKKLHDEGDIFAFDIQENKVILTICWEDHPPKNTPGTDMWCTYGIEAETIYWENIPNLHNPYWI